MISSAPRCRTLRLDAKCWRASSPSAPNNPISRSSVTVIRSEGGGRGVPRVSMAFQAFGSGCRGGVLGELFRKDDPWPPRPRVIFDLDHVPPKDLVEHLRTFVAQYADRLNARAAGLPS